MKKGIATEISFADMMIPTSSKPSFLQKIDKIIDWMPMEKSIVRHCGTRVAADGRPGYPALVMFKILLLQKWYGLSDPAMEEALCDRISFIRFAGLSVVSDKPDETTICRFRNKLNQKGFCGRLLKRVNRQLARKGLLVKGGAIVDATLVESSRRPRKTVESIPEDRREEEESSSNSSSSGSSSSSSSSSSSGCTVSYSGDADARWLKKGKKAYYGYKIHAATDIRDGFVLGGHATGANRADTKEFQNVLDRLDLPAGSPVAADKGYPSAENRRYLRERGLLDCILFKAARGKPLTVAQKQANKMIGRVRFKIERTFGTLKRTYRFRRARYLGRAKTEAEFHLHAMAFNIKKAALMVS